MSTLFRLGPWSMVMFMVQSNLRRYIRDSKDIGKAQLNKRSCHRMNCPSFKGYSVQRCMFNQVHFQNYGGRQRRRGLEAWNGFHCDRHRLCSFLRGRLRCLLYRFAFLPISQKSLCLCLWLSRLLYTVGFYEINVILANFTIMPLPTLSSIYRFAVSSKLFVFTTVTFIKVVMFDCSMHCMQ